MEIGKELSSVIEDCFQALETDPHGNLELGYRRAVWLKLGPKFTGNNPQAVGYLRRCHLAKLAVRKVWPIWTENMQGEEDIPDTSLQHIDRVIAGLYRRSSAKEALMRMAGVLENLIYNHFIFEQKTHKPMEKYLNALSAGYSAISALGTAIADEIYDPDTIDYTVVDQDVDAYESDASYYAASAFAYGNIWNEKSDPVKRKEFWTWWLTEAVPEAWASVPDTEEETL